MACVILQPSKAHCTTSVASLYTVFIAYCTHCEHYTSHCLCYCILLKCLIAYIFLIQSSTTTTTNNIDDEDESKLSYPPSAFATVV